MVLAKFSLFICLFVSNVFCAFAQTSEIQSIQLQKLKSFSQKGTKLYVRCDCWDDNQFRQEFLTELGAKGNWRIVNSVKEADFILFVNAWSRPQVAGIVYESYAIIYDSEDHLLYKTNLYIGQPTIVNGYDPRRASIKNLINDGFFNEIPKSKWIYTDIIDLMGSTKIDERKYNEAEVCFWEGLDYYNQYNFKDAIDLFTKSLNINPYCTFTLRYRSLSFYHLSKFKDARNDIIKIMKMDPMTRQNDTIYYNIMIGKNEKFMKTWGPGGTADKIIGSLNVVNQTFNSINSANINSSNSAFNNETSTQSNKNQVTKQQICTLCHGTGKSPSKEYPAEFGLGHTYKDTPCEICGSYTSHYHKNCPSCNGKGYVLIANHRD